MIRCPFNDTGFNYHGEEGEYKDTHRNASRSVRVPGDSFFFLLHITEQSRLLGLESMAVSSTLFSINPLMAISRHIRSAGCPLLENMVCRFVASSMEMREPLS